MMNDIRVYIANLGKYNEGELVGAWFTPPIDYEEVKERIGLNSEYEEFAIHDFEAPFSIPTYSSIDEINHLASLLEEVSSEPFAGSIGDMIGYWFSDLEELVDHKDEIIVYHDCDSILDVAYMVVEEGGMLSGVDESLTRYFNYEAFARDLEIVGNYLVTKLGVIEYIS